LMERREGWELKEKLPWAIAVCVLCLTGHDGPQKRLNLQRIHLTNLAVLNNSLHCNKTTLNQQQVSVCIPLCDYRGSSFR
jgi:hypothetical protein